jgi:hypothetical protein
MEACSSQLRFRRPKIRLEGRDGHGEILVWLPWPFVELRFVLPIEEDAPDLGLRIRTRILLTLKEADYYPNFGRSLDAILE